LIETVVRAAATLTALLIGAGVVLLLRREPRAGRGAKDAS